MANAIGDGERISLSKLDTRVLIALLSGRMSGYEIKMACEKDLGWPVGNGTLFPALSRLERSHCIEEVQSATGGPGRPRRTYITTATGREVLAWEVADMQTLAKLASDRRHMRTC